jgi:hypothetical protein
VCYLFKAAGCFFVPKIVTVVALLYKACAFIYGVSQYVAKLAEGAFGEGPPICRLHGDLASKRAHRCFEKVYF